MHLRFIWLPKRVKNPKGKDIFFLKYDQSIRSQKDILKSMSHLFKDDDFISFLQEVELVCY